MAAWLRAALCHIRVFLRNPPHSYHMGSSVLCLSTDWISPMTNWTALIPAKIRTALYIGFGVLSLTQTAILAYTSAVGGTAPVWAIGGGAVLGVIGGAFGFVAAGNTDLHRLHETDAPAPPAEPDTFDDVIRPRD